MLADAKKDWAQQQKLNEIANVTDDAPFRKATAKSDKEFADKIQKNLPPQRMRALNTQYKLGFKGIDRSTDKNAFATKLVVAISKKISA